MDFLGKKSLPPICLKRINGIEKNGPDFGWPKIFLKCVFCYPGMGRRRFIFFWVRKIRFGVLTASRLIHRFAYVGYSVVWFIDFWWAGPFLWSSSVGPVYLGRKSNNVFSDQSGSFSSVFSSPFPPLLSVVSAMKILVLDKKIRKGYTLFELLR